MQAIRITADLADVAERVAHRLAHGREHRVGACGEAVIHPQAFAAGLDKAGAAKVGQVAGRLRLRNLETLVDVAHADLAREEQAENPQPGRVAERLEQSGERVYLGFHIRVDKYTTTRIQFQICV